MAENQQLEDDNLNKPGESLPANPEDSQVHKDITKDPNICKRFMFSTCVYGTRCRYDHPHQLTNLLHISKRLDTIMTVSFDTMEKCELIQDKIHHIDNKIIELTKRVDQCVLCNQNERAPVREPKPTSSNMSTDISRRSGQRGRGRKGFRSSSRDRLKKDIQRADNKELKMHDRILKTYQS